MPTAIAMVRANWLYSWPVSPGMKATGTNTAISTRVVATIGPRTSAIASSVTSRRSLPPSSRRRLTFSTTTIASSTTSATATTRPSRLSVLIVKPNTAIAANAPISETGTAMVGISVLRQFCRKTKITSSTSPTACSMVLMTSVIEARTNMVVS